jgi:hypothetical protein
VDARHTLARASGLESTWMRASPGRKDAKPETKKDNNYAVNPNNEDWRVASTPSGIGAARGYVVGPAAGAGTGANRRDAHGALQRGPVEGIL